MSTMPAERTTKRPEEDDLDAVDVLDDLDDLDVRVAESRRLVERRVADLREAAHADLGLVPRGGGWVLPVVGFAVGFGLAVRAFRRRRRLQRG
jgi:hypothetical protein